MKKQQHKLLTFTVLFASATVIIHFTNKLISAAAQLKEMLDTSSKNFFHWRFGDIYYTKKGSGSPLLLIHDALPGSSGYEWSRIEKELATKRTVYTIDLLGCGRSEKPGMTYTNFVYVQMICDFIKNIIGEKTDVIASGFSSSFITMACRNEKELFNKIILVNPPSLNILDQMPANKQKLLKRMLEIPVFGTLIYHMAVSHESVDNLFVEKMYYNPFHVNEDIVDAYYEAAHKGSFYAKYFYASMASGFMNINVSHALKSLENCVIIQGEEEPSRSSTADEYLKANPALETVVIKKAKHLPHIENPEDFLEQIGIFF